MRVADALKRVDADGVWAFTPNTFSALLGGVEPNYRKLMLKRLCDREVLVRAAKGVYVNPVARSQPTDVRLGLVPYLRPGEVSYVSLEFRLSEVGAISQIASALTLMTTGSSHRFDTPWGVIDFTHSDRSEPLADGVEFVEGGSVPIAMVERAYRDLKRVGRNLDLVDMEVLSEVIQEEADERPRFGP